jgi:tetratricopeptide (TPR) repeat protein
MKFLLIIYFCFSFIIIFSQQSEEMFVKGVEALNKGDYQLADSLLTKSISYDMAYGKKDFLKFYNRGLALKYMDSIPQAIKNYDTSIMLRPNYSLSYQERAICRFLYDEDTLALADINRSLSIDNQNIESYVVKILINFDLKNYKSIILDCSKALSIEKDSRFYGFRAISNLYLGKTEMAKKDIDVGKKLYNADIHIVEAEVFLLFKTGQPICTKHCELMKIDPNFFYSVLDKELLVAIEKCK